jgi:hypothetical protein
MGGGGVGGRKTASAFFFTANKRQRRRRASLYKTAHPEQQTTTLPPPPTLPRNTTKKMNNGCICCTVRGDLIRILGKLLKRRSKFDHIMIETTGLANPAPVIQTFFVDDDLKEATRLDAVVTVADAKHLLQHLDEKKPEGVVNEAGARCCFFYSVCPSATHVIHNPPSLPTPPSTTNQTKTNRDAGRVCRPRAAQQDRPRRAGRARRGQAAHQGSACVWGQSRCGFWGGLGCWCYCTYVFFF